GGLYTGRINVLNVKTGDTNASCFNLHASEMTVNNCSFIGPAMMWMELTARKGQGFNRKSNSYIINSQFVGPVTSNAGVSLVQGDSKEHNYSFLRNNFHNSSNGVFGFYGGVAGSIIIEDNNLDSVGQAMYFGIAPGYLSDSKNKNIIFKNNKVSASGSFIQFYNRVENVTIKENVFRGISQHSTAMIYGNCTMKNILVENNIFYNCRVTEQNASLNGGKRPYFKKNKYINPLFRDSQGKQVISNSNPKVKPISEFLQLYLDEIETIDIDTLGINDGQILQIEILNDKGPGQNLKNRNKEKNTIFYKYNERKGKWILQQS
ncbi:MAG: hypothetical protein KDC52_16360, partial [Ignavibacteriae bacterium]|nr:hypothetical protein [Ignavibacteriota bacterium]